MRKNVVIEKLSLNLPALGSWVMSDSVVSAEILARSGFCWVCIDAEHSQISKAKAVDMIRAIELHGAEPFVRVCSNEESEIKKFLDMGARGIIVPMIKSIDDLKRAISYIRFAPQGNRSYSLARCTGYGMCSQEYFTSANSEIFIGIMIEHIDAVAHLDAIFSHDQIDSVFVGPYDLSGSLGKPGDFNNPAFIEAMNQITRKAKEYGITMGCHEVHPTIDGITALLDRGMRFIACGIDTLFLSEKAYEFATMNISRFK